MNIKNALGYCHYLQSQTSGLIYIFKYGLPSLLDGTTNQTDHNKTWVEQDADIRGYNYFKDNPDFYNNKFQWTDGMYYSNMDWFYGFSKINQQPLGYHIYP